MLLEQIYRHAARRPEQAAVRDERSVLSYAGLARESRRIAAALAAAAPARGALIAIYHTRCAALVAAIVAVWRAGASYTIVEADGVTEEHYRRLQTISPDLVLTTREHEAGLVARGLPVCVVDFTAVALATDAPGAAPSDTPAPPAAADPAYVLFTSGSTGVPKGVVVTHGNIAHYVDAIATRLGIEPGLAYAHVSTMSADLGNTGLFLSLYTGGTLHVIEDARRKDPAALLDYLVAQRVDVLKITPSHWEAMFALLGAGRTHDLALRHLILGGEAFPVRLAAAILEAGVTRSLVNHYGPTETTIGITACLVDHAGLAALAADATVPVGRPLGATRLRVRTDSGYAGCDAQGELFVGGPGVSAGYRNNPEANAKAFVTDVEGDARFYRTGDMVRIDADGVVHFLGRVDRQVKVNGYRIELEQIERTLKSLDGCEGAAAFLLTIRERPAIVAAVLTRGGRGAPGIRSELATLLPAYMLPRELLVLPAFPLNPNGKTDLAALRAIVETDLRTARPAAVANRATAAAGPVDNAGDHDGDDLRSVVRAAWRKCLGIDAFSDDADFFALGGDSLDAIEVIAQLQAAGQPVSARAFLKQPTVAALLDSIRRSACPAPAVPPQPDPDRTVPFAQLSAAQQQFLETRLNRVDHHNQALLFDLDGPVSAPWLARALDCVRRWHPLLSTRFRRNGETWFAQAQPDAPRDALLPVTEIEPAHGPDAARALIRRTSQALQASLSLEAGRLFAAHLFMRANGTGHLLLCAHHVAVDAVSWRIVVDDLQRVYGALAAHQPLPPTPRSRPLWDWTAHLASTPALEGDLAYWRRLPSNRVSAALQRRPERNLERHARACWCAFSRDTTARLLRELPAQLGAPFHHVLLAAYMKACDATLGADPHGWLVEVESHGRVSFDDAVDVSRTVGWLTSACPVAFGAPSDDFAAAVAHVSSVLDAVPNLGVAYGVHRAALREAWGGLPLARHCYNFLGHFDHDADGPLKLRPSTGSPGFARGYDNDRLHEFRMTARIIDDQLICDLGYSGEHHDDAKIEALMTRVAVLLCEAAAPLPLAGRAAPGFRLYVEAGSSAGLLAYRPAALGLDRVPGRRRRTGDRYAEILLTGATGFVGAYLLRDLLHETTARVHCVVRGETDAHAARRLAEAFDGYFPAAPLANYGERVSVHAGDVTQERLGLAPAVYARLDRSVDAIYHLAADTRLFATEEALDRQNVLGTRRVIAFAQGLRPKHLHHMSTLAVCGVVDAPQAIAFDETSLEIGQTFQNAYERSKFQAEKLVGEFVSRGGRAFIYRSGNVSADSVSGRFQHNATDNRFIQLLRAALRLGTIPGDLDEAVTLSPVDLVSRGMVKLSLDEAASGTVFHVDSPWEIALGEVFEVLAELGVSLETSRGASFAELFGRGFGAADRDIALGYFWATRPRRGVRFDHSRTLRRLDGLACGFGRPTREWLHAFMAHLLETGALSRQSAVA
ncbi:thioester reductase domain-containing protein [Burkholderia plantarii]|uniref:thioester reductase domain-containing protein n=1 Tax=Burkholderia plantarii TaxID=41899 RepID=UPI000706A6C1|nr:thioester reductase domain-containing protein [Burkholderia plantarii]ALK34057.1 AMP-dependent synthetase and ligase [Burkholderia plantarii]GLZ21471.1 hypothetical protein Bpla01_50000 [Burkholderia plantarii]